MGEDVGGDDVEPAWNGAASDPWTRWKRSAPIPLRPRFSDAMRTASASRSTAAQPPRPEFPGGDHQDAGAGPDVQK